MAVGQIKRYALNSRFLDEERRFWVYYPAEFDAHKSYPVLYAHDGEDYLTMGRIRTIMNELVAKKKLHPLVIVGIPVHKKHRTAEYHPKGERHQAYTSFIAEELVPFVETKELAINASERATIGSSLGAVVACQLAWNYPGLFERVISQSGAFYDASTTAALQTVRNPQDIHYYLMVGEDEVSVPVSVGTVNFVEHNRAFRNMLQKLDAPFDYKECPGNHTWGLWQKNLPDALSYFWNVHPKKL